MIRRAFTLATASLLALLVASCASSTSSSSTEPASEPTLKITFRGVPSARYDPAMRATQLSVDLTISNPSIYDIEVERVWILVKDSRGDNAHVEAVESDSLRTLWGGEPRVPARAQRWVPARFFMVGKPALDTEMIPAAANAVRLEAWVEGVDPKGNDVRAHAEFRERIRGLGEQSPGIQPPND